MGSRFFLPIPVKRRKNASRISRPCTMHTSMPNKRDWGVRSVRTIYKRRGSATRRREGIGKALSPQFHRPLTGEVAMAHGAHLGRSQCDDRSGFAFQGGEFHLVGLPVTIDVNHRSHIARYKPFGGDGRDQYHSVVFSDHSVMAPVLSDTPLPDAACSRPRQQTTPVARWGSGHSASATLHL